MQGQSELPSSSPISQKDMPVANAFMSAKGTLQALKAFKQLATVRPGDPEIAKMLARLYHQLGNPEEAKNVLQAHLHDYPTAVDLTHINILAELYMEASEWGLAVDNIQYADAQLCGQAGLPVELQVQLHSLLCRTKIMHLAHFACLRMDTLASLSCSH